ncbi:MAG: adenylate cyclase [marine bacterium B5-7]|nr:MAG: adenylate cyclase [marine bacterium B5-7]
MDPYPRQYPSLATLVRRASLGPDIAPSVTTSDEICRWLLSEAISEKDLLPLLEALIWRMVAASIPIDRVTIHVGTLHPELLGFYWHWNRADHLVDELKVDWAGFDTERYKQSPLAKVIDGGQSFRASTDDQDMIDRYPLLADLKAQGMHDYVIFPLGSGTSFHNAATLATCCESGFSDSDMRDCRRILDIFALHVERQIVWRIAVNVVDTYLGAVAGKRVLSGEIRRGAGESIRAIIWMSDLRGFSSLTDHLAGTDVITLLNEYFERLASAVINHGGEILKFIGDGLLAVFPVSTDVDERAAAAASLSAAEQALWDVDELNRHPPEALNHISGWRPLNSGIALHLGEVFFGNVGAAERLDFTVIGRAVNEVSRVEALTRQLDRSVLITEPVAQLLDRKFEDMGLHQLRGLSSQVRLYSFLSDA